MIITFWFLYPPTTDEDSVWARRTYGPTEQDDFSDLQLTVVSRWTTYTVLYVGNCIISNLLNVLSKLKDMNKIIVFLFSIK